MRHRDLVALREFRQEEERIERERRERHEKREAAEKARREREREKDRQSVAREFHREIVAEGGQDVHFLINIDPKMLNIRMTQAEAEAFNKREAERFARECLEYAAYKSHATFQQLSGYLEQNGARIVSAEMLRVAFERLRDLSLIHRNPEPKPAPAPKAVNLTIEKPTYGDRVNGGMLGRDWETGKDKVFSPREVERMSSVEYKRAFPTVQTIAEWLTASADTRGAARS